MSYLSEHKDFVLAVYEDVEPHLLCGSVAVPVGKDDKYLYFLRHMIADYGALEVFVIDDVTLRNLDAGTAPARWYDYIIIYRDDNIAVDIVH